jgi:hypothetical protein
MSYKISFQERAKLAMEHLSRQSPVTYEKALEQVKRLKEMSQSKVKKQSTIN